MTDTTAQINATAEQSATLASEVKSYVVGKLEDLSKKELSANEYLVRKIERNTGLDSKGCIIPATTAESFIKALENDTILQGAVSWYQEVVAEVVKARMTAGRSVINEVDFSQSEIVKYLAEQEIKQGKVSKEKISNWFDATLVQGISEAFAARLGTQFTTEVKEQVLGDYKKWFAKLTSADLAMEADTKGSLLKACSFAPEDSAIRQYCEGKIKAAKLPSAMLKLL